MAPGRRWPDAPARLPGPLEGFELGHRSRRVDLLGTTDQGRLVVIELKVRRKDGSCGDTPLLALMEGLSYAAVVQANHRAIAVEARESWSMNVSEEPPIVQILAPEDWWRGWCDIVGSTRRDGGRWEPAFLELAAELEARLGIVVLVPVPPEDRFGRRHLGRRWAAPRAGPADAPGSPGRCAAFAVMRGCGKSCCSESGAHPAKFPMGGVAWTTGSNYDNGSTTHLHNGR